MAKKRKAEGGDNLIPSSPSSTTTTNNPSAPTTPSQQPPSLPSRRKKRTRKKHDRNQTTTTTTTTGSSPPPTSPKTKPPPASHQQQHTIPHNTDLILTGDKRHGLYECDFCRRDISQVPRIRCAICPDFDSCLDCFATTDPSAASSLRRSLMLEDTETSSSPTAGTTPTTTLPNGDSVEKANVTSSSTTTTPKTPPVSKSADGGHNPSHGYRVADSTRFPVFPHKSMELWEGSKSIDDIKTVWTAEEDLRLLDAVSTLGLGNWADVSEAVGNNKSAKRCMERYCDDYLGRYGRILPMYTLVETTTTEENEENGEEEEKEEDGSVTSVSTTWSTTSSVTSKRKKKRGERLGPSALEQMISSQQKPKKYKWVLTSSLPGYDDVWPDPYVPPIGKQLDEEVGRDVAYRAEQAYVKALTNVVTQSEATKLRSEWKAKADDPDDPAYKAKVLPPRLEDIRSLKGSELAGYMPRRGDFDVEWDNDAESILADMEFNPNDHPKERKLKLDIIQIYNKKLDERDRRRRFLEDWNLLDYRINQAELHELPPDERQLIQRMRLFARFHSKDQHTLFLRNLLKAKALRKEIAKCQLYRTMGIKTIAEVEKYELDKQRREFHRREHEKKDVEEKQQQLEFERYAKESSATIMANYARQERKHRKSREPTDEERDEETNKEEGAEPKTKQENEPNDEFDISDKDGYQLLSSKEIRLCKSIQLLPQQYLEAKKAIIQKSFEAGMLDKDDAARTIVKIDVQKRKDVVDFVVGSGWVMAKPVGSTE